MIGLWNISGKNKKYRSILTIYALHSLKQKPKSGYEMLSEIRKKSEGKWAPSKGALYPALRQLEEGKLIRVYETGSRKKNIFGLTAAGKKALSGLGKRRKEWRENFLKFRNLFAGILGEEHAKISCMLFEIKDASLALPENRKKETAKILQKCLSELKRLKSQDMEGAA